MRMILLAKDALPWVLLSSLVSAASVSVGTVALHYRAEVLTTLQRSSRPAAASSAMAARVAPVAAGARKAILAMVLVELQTKIKALEAKLATAQAANRRRLNTLQKPVAGRQSGDGLSSCAPWQARP